MKTMTEKEAQMLVDDILTRGVGTFVDPSDEFRKKIIAKATGGHSKDIFVKFGVDPTRPDIHLGHAVVLHKLRQMQELGVKIIFLIGDYTAQIGDPTGKSKVRPEVEQAAIEANMLTYLDQVGKILKLDQSVFSWIRNSDWFTSASDLNLPDDARVEFEVNGQKALIPPNSFVGKSVVFEKTRMQVKMGLPSATLVTMTNLLWGLKHITLAQLIERDMFQKRINEGESLYMHEMLYPVLQGVDSDVLYRVYGSCDMEIGGTDQTFNMLMGRKIMEINHKAPQAVLALELLVGLDGKEKMSKSLDNYVGITDEPADMFGKLMSLPDSAIPTYLELCTFTPLEEVKAIVSELESGKAHPKEVKMNLAQQIVDIYHGRDAGVVARGSFVNTFQKKEVPDDLKEVEVVKGTKLADTLLGEGLVASKSDFRRLIEEGAVREGGETKIDDPQFAVDRDIVLKIGKHRFIRITVK